MEVSDARNQLVLCNYPRAAAVRHRDRDTVRAWPDRSTGLMQLEQEEDKHRRVMDTSNGDAKRAVAETLAQFGPWRVDLAQFMAHVERGISSADREKMLARCAAIEDELLAARTELIVGLAEAPRKVAGHSRVVDVEKALDNIEAGVKALRAKLTQ